MPQAVQDTLQNLLQDRILLLDGSMGALIMARRLRSQVSDAAAPLIVADNWFEELRARAGREE